MTTIKFLTIGLILLSVVGCVVHPTNRARHQPVGVVAVSGHSHHANFKKASRRIEHHGQAYYLNKGRFYREKRGEFVIVTPPAGLRLTVLPTGFVKVKRHGRWYYHHHGVYLEWRPQLKVYIVVK